jgi:hypothetical protein
MLAVSVVIKDDIYIDDLLTLANEHDIEYYSRKSVANGTLFVFNFNDGEEKKKDAFYNAIPVKWI